MIADQLIVGNKTANKSYTLDKKSEDPMRSIAKSISWRIIGTVDTIINFLDNNGNINCSYVYWYCRIIYQNDFIFFSRTYMEYH